MASMTLMFDGKPTAQVAKLLNEIKKKGKVTIQFYSFSWNMGIFPTPIVHFYGKTASSAYGERSVVSHLTAILEGRIE